MAYSVLSRNGEESFNKLLSNDPDPYHLRGGPSHRDNIYFLCKTINSIATRTDRLTNKQTDTRVYKHTGNDKDYEVYKEALNAATNEVRKAKRNFEHKLAQNIKSDSKSFYAYVRSKQNVRDKVGPLKDNAGNIITEGCLMAEELNMHFSSVFTRKDTSSLPVPETKFNGSD